MVMRIKLGHNQSLSSTDDITQYFPESTEPFQTPIPLGANKVTSIGGKTYFDGQQRVFLLLNGVSHTQLNSFVTTFYASGWLQKESVAVTVSWLANDLTYDTYNAYLDPLNPDENYQAVWRDQLRDVRIPFNLL